VVVVTIWAYGTGVGYTPPMISPEMWEISATSQALSESAIWDNFSQSRKNG
jgi:hypothetical protein